MTRPVKSSEPPLWDTVLAVALKDLRLEARSRQAVVAMLAFAAMLVFAHRALAESLTPAQAALAVWTVLLFTSLFGLFHSFAHERDTRTLPALLLAPCRREAIYLGKLLANLLLLAAVEAVVLLLFGLAFQQDFVGGAAGLAVLGVGTLGLVAAGTLLSALIGGRGNRLLLPILMIPLVLFTVVVPALDLHRAALAQETFAPARLALIGFFDLMLLALGVLLCESAVEP